MSLSRCWPEKISKCEFDVQPDMMLSCDANKLQRVFDNLLRNAVSYCYENTTIQVKARQTEDHVLIQVINEGIRSPRRDWKESLSSFIAWMCHEAQAPAEPVWDLRLQRDCGTAPWTDTLPAAKTVSPVLRLHCPP